MTLLLNKEEDRSFKNFYRSLKSKYTKREYTKYLKMFLLFCKEESYDALLYQNNEKVIEEKIMDFIYHLNEKNLSESFLKVSTAALKHFYSINDVELKWRKISKFIGEGKPVGDDRPYSRQELQKLMEFGSLREKIIVSLCSSSGMRIGAVPSLKWGDLEPITIDNQGVDIYMIKVYAGHKEKYKTFCTPESRRYIDEYIDYRKRYGEEITNESPLIREEFDIRDRESIVNARCIMWDTVRKMIHTLKKRSGIHTSAKNVHSSHGLRKFFDTTCTNAGVFPLYIEKMMGHALPGMKGHYFKPTDYEILMGNDKNLGYVAAINDLTINDENRLKTKVRELQIESQKIKELEKRYEAELRAIKEDMENKFKKISDRIDFSKV